MDISNKTKKETSKKKGDKNIEVKDQEKQ